MDRTTVVELIEAFYRIRLTNDIACFERMSPDAVLRIAGSPDASPIAGSSRDPDSLRSQVAALIADWAWRSFEIESMTIDGNRAAIHYRLGVQYVPTGDVLDSEVLDLLTFENGKIISYVEFIDTAAVAAIAAKMSN